MRAADSFLLPCPDETKEESMARKIKARLILQQLAAGTSRNAIARSLGVSKHSIQAVAEAAERERIS